MLQGGHGVSSWHQKVYWPKLLQTSATSRDILLLFLLLMHLMQVVLVMCNFYVVPFPVAAGGHVQATKALEP